MASASVSKKGAKGAGSNRRRIAAQEAEGGTGGIRLRSSDPTGFDNDQYMAELEANLMKAMNIQPDDQPTKVYNSNRSGSKGRSSGLRTSSANRMGLKSGGSGTKTRKEESPSKLGGGGKTRQPIAARS